LKETSTGKERESVLMGDLRRVREREGERESERVSERERE